MPVTEPTITISYPKNSIAEQQERIYPTTLGYVLIAVISGRFPESCWLAVAPVRISAEGESASSMSLARWEGMVVGLVPRISGIVFEESMNRGLRLGEQNRLSAATLSPKAKEETGKNMKEEKLL